MDIVKRIVKFCRPYWLYQVMSLLCAFLETGSYLIMPFIIKLFIDDALIKRNNELFLRLLLLYFLSIASIVIFGFLKEMLYKMIDENVIKDSRLFLYKTLSNAELKDTQNYKIGSQMSYFINDIPQMCSGITANFIEVIQYVLRIITGLVVLAVISIKLLLILIMLLPLYLFVARIFNKPIKETSQDVQAQNAVISETLQEHLSAKVELTVFNNKNWSEVRVSEAFMRYIKLAINNTMWIKLSGNSGYIIYWLAIVMIYFIGGRNVINGLMTIGTLLLYVQYMDNIYMPSKLLLDVNNNFQKIIASGERYFELIDKINNNEDASKTDKIKIKEFINHIQFNHVSFGYGEDLNLKDINFEIKKGEVVAIIGQSGTGKSTLTKLLLNLFKPSSGKILLDGEDIDNIDRESLYNIMGVVFQDPFLFSDSIRSNISFGNLEASMEEIMGAAKLVNADDFIRSTQDGYSTLIGERASKLSGGQKQRIAIARTLLRNPDIFIFDEITSALDTENQKIVYDTISKLKRDNKTIILITHDMKNLKNVDKIVILDNGTVAAVGTCSEILGSCSAYEDLNDSSLGI